MMRFAVRGLLGRKLRTVLTAIAVVLGVAMVAGTYVLTDSISSAFDSIFGETYRNTDAAITGKSAFDLSNDNNTGTVPSFDESLLARVRGLADVGAALGGVADEAHLIGKNGKAIVFGGAPNLGFSVDPSQPQFNSLKLVDGAWPSSGELVVDGSTAQKKDLSVGDTIGVQARGPVERLRISGLVKFGAVSSIGGATLAGFDLATAQKLFDKEGKLDQIRMAAKPGVSPEQLVAEVRQILPPGTQVRTGTAQATEDSADTSGFISFLQKFLLAFGGVALFVGSFVIANSLSITIAQRTREFATLRTLGASRRQVLVFVIVEALAMGAAASVIGLFSGLALAKGLFKLFDAVGFTLPNSGLLLETRTIVVALVIGVVVTLLASLRPAFRATRVPPIAAVREGATLPPGRLARFRVAGSVVLAAAGFALLLLGLFAHGLGTTKVLIFMLVGALLVFFGIALFSSRLVRPLAAGANPIARWAVFALSVLAWPLFSASYWLLRYGAWGPGSTGRRIGAFLVGAVLNPLLLLLVLAMSARRLIASWRPEWPAQFPGVLADRASTRLGSENSQRNPERTASTAAALMIGLALVTLVATLAAGIIKPFEDAVDKIFTSDYAITAQNNFDPIPPSAAEAAAKTPGLEAIASVRGGEGRAFGDSIQVTAVDPQTPQVMTLDWKAGGQETLGSLGADGVIVDDGYAKDHKLVLGSPITLLTPTGERVPLRVRGIFDPPTGGSPFGAVTISSATFDRKYQEPKNLFTFVKMRGGVTEANTEALRASLASFPNAKSVTRDEFKDNQISGLKSILNVLYVLLALSVVVSLFGMVNTFVLTVFERTRELGMLRAIGMTRLQARRMIRHESVITALIGAALGIVLGLVLAGLLVARLDFISFALPVQQLVVFAVASVVVGILAAIFPARRAARLNPLEALHYE
jgi:putative ABC transport system permease protein